MALWTDGDIFRGNKLSDELEEQALNALCIIGLKREWKEWKEMMEEKYGCSISLEVCYE